MLLDFWHRHPEAEQPFRNWHTNAERSRFALLGGPNVAGHQPSPSLRPWLSGSGHTIHFTLDKTEKYENNGN
jgi:hypothetical protein